MHILVREGEVARIELFPVIRVISPKFMSTNLNYHLLRVMGKATVSIKVYLRIPLPDRISENGKSMTKKLTGAAWGCKVTDFNWPFPPLARLRSCCLNMTLNI